MTLGVICRVLLFQILQVRQLHCWLRVMNRPVNDWVQARTSWVRLTARITPSVLPLAQDNAWPHTRVSSLHQLTSIKTATLFCGCLLLLLFIRHLVIFIQGLRFHACDDSWVEIQTKRTIRAENEVEANKLVNNYRVRSEKCFRASVKGSALCRFHLDKRPTFASYASDTFLEMCTSTHSFWNPPFVMSQTSSARQSCSHVVFVIFQTSGRSVCQKSGYTKICHAAPPDTGTNDDMIWTFHSRLVLTQWLIPQTVLCLSVHLCDSLVSENGRATWRSVRLKTGRRLWRSSTLNWTLLSHTQVRMVKIC